MSKKNVYVVVLFFVLAGLAGMGIFVKTKYFSSPQAKVLAPEVKNLNSRDQKQRQRSIKEIIEQLPAETQAKIKKEQEKVLALNGKVEKIEAKTLSVKAMAGKIKDKIYNVVMSPEAKIMLTKIDAKTGIPSTSAFSLEKIKIGDEIIVWAEQDLRDKTEFESKYLEVILR
ncbi:hypothetical protein KJ797_01290 [Patescibacteria group bacterium]|nr:hypothetical protein [Patescibacteria group bacterium]MBU2263955.1 hypothetical protein [Patescibacteria group bacterium]